MRNRRWLRFALPFAVVAGLATTTGIAHAVQQPDPTDAAFLSPTSDDGEGARLLADELTRRGIRVDVRTSTEDVLAAVAANGSATVFVAAPELVHPAYLDRLVRLPAGVRVVLVAPRKGQLDSAGLDVPVAGPRWTAAAPQPGCSAPFSSAGAAATLRWRYDGGAYDAVQCFEDGVAEFQVSGLADVTLVGAVDPFRNDRADEHANHAFATALLSRNDRVLWLDLHERERPPRTQPTQDPYEQDDPEWTDGGADGDGTGSDQDGEPRDPSTGQPRDGEGQTGGGGTALTDSPLARAFPPAVWATLALLVAAAIALALASARRLGAPVAEPLPVRVRAAETVRGLGGLYRRAGARSTSLATVRSAALARLAEHYDLPADTPADDLAERVAADTGHPVDDVRHVLAGSVEDSDGELVRAATAVQTLVRYVTGQQNWRQAPDEGNLT
ncbi:DUF4350 domain-containing protein [Couchioplanes caeruleus]|uniref:DUF4350 domain-containing protein n=1 Tax=Couchioplanes caeruleus TaxID=56438 RepID=UPI0020BE618F|nr:DUF4350 domain-containing protein [Couchioplanes caeruleus]UQU63417.1 DUF4350 domain-containing protein [Couchioplanes caeruleus]